MSRNIIKLILVVTALALMAAPALAGSVTIPNTFSANTVAKASEVNANFTAIKTEVDDNDARIAALEALVTALTAKLAAVSDDGTDFVITGRNVHIVSGSGSTDDGGSLTGKGNLIIGYNEDMWVDDIRTGSHNLVIGPEHTYSSYGGFVAGYDNAITNTSASVSGGDGGIASGVGSSVSGGYHGMASGSYSSVSGGAYGRASGNSSSVSGGGGGEASGDYSSISGGWGTASGDHSSISGGGGGIASGDSSSVSGGAYGKASGFASSVSGGVYSEASGNNSSVSGGHSNIASGWASSVIGGYNNEAAGVYDTVIGGTGNTANSIDSTDYEILPSGSTF